MAYVTQDNRYFLQDGRLYLLMILKRPEIKDDYVEPKQELPESGIVGLAILSRMGMQDHS